MKRNKRAIEKVAKILLKRGDADMWGAEENTLEACERLVCEVLDACEVHINAGDHYLVEDIWMQELGLEPDYLYETLCLI